MGLDALARPVPTTHARIILDHGRVTKAREVLGEGAENILLREGRRPGGVELLAHRIARGRDAGVVDVVVEDEFALWSVLDPDAPVGEKLGEAVEFP